MVTLAQLIKPLSEHTKAWVPTKWAIVRYREIPKPTSDKARLSAMTNAVGAAPTSPLAPLASTSRFANVSSRA